MHLGSSLLYSITRLSTIWMNARKWSASRFLLRISMQAPRHFFLKNAQIGDGFCKAHIWGLLHFKILLLCCLVQFCSCTCFCPSLCWGITWSTGQCGTIGYWQQALSFLHGEEWVSPLFSWHPSSWIMDLGCSFMRNSRRKELIGGFLEVLRWTLGFWHSSNTPTFSSKI